MDNLVDVSLQTRFEVSHLWPPINIARILLALRLLQLCVDYVTYGDGSAPRAAKLLRFTSTSRTFAPAQAMKIKLHCCDSGELAQAGAVCPAESSTESTFLCCSHQLDSTELDELAVRMARPWAILKQFAVRPKVTRELLQARLSAN
jgi:hypothetical protein